MEKLEVFQDLMKKEKKSKIKPPDLIKLTKDKFSNKKTFSKN